MVRTEQLNYIQLLHERGEGSLKISKRIGLSRNTVRKYLALLDSGQPIVLRVQRARALDPYKEVVKSLFVDCRGHCPNLQRRLKEQQGLDVQLRTLQKYCQPWRKTVLKPQERAVRYEVESGNEMQIDFGCEDIEIKGQKTRICIFVAVLSYSRRVFVKIYPGENQAAWLDGIESAFAYFQGVPVAVVSDNTRCLVEKRDEKGRAVFTRAYQYLARHWRFVKTACRPYRAKTKGKVERMVGYVKTSCLAGMKVDNLEQAQQEINRWLQEVADVRTIQGLAGTPRDRFLTEMSALSPCDKVPVTNLRLQTRIVNASSLIIVNNRRYELVDTEPGTQVEIMEEPETITVYHHGQKLCTKNKATDEYKANTFRHEPRPAPWWPPLPVVQPWQRSLKVYEKYILEANHAHR